MFGTCCDYPASNPSNHHKNVKKWANCSLLKRRKNCSAWETRNRCCKVCSFCGCSFSPCSLHYYATFLLYLVQFSHKWFKLRWCIDDLFSWFANVLNREWVSFYYSFDESPGEKKCLSLSLPGATSIPFLLFLCDDDRLTVVAFMRNVFLMHALWLPKWHYLTTSFVSITPPNKRPNRSRINWPIVRLAVATFWSRGIRVNRGDAAITTTLQPLLMSFLSCKLCS